jgi:hypothetical protein
MDLRSRKLDSFFAGVLATSGAEDEYRVMASNLLLPLNPRASKAYHYYMLRILLIILEIAAPMDVWAAAPSGHFKQRLLQLQRQGSCAELPLFGVSTHQHRNPDDINVKLASEVEARVVRLDIFWGDLEHRGQYNFQPYDYLVNELRRTNRSIILVLGYGHPDHSDGHAENGPPLAPRTQEQLAAYDRYVQAVATRYHGSDIIYEIWNEPNLSWAPVPDATAYGRLLAEAAKAIRRIEPLATIISGGLANEHSPSEFLGEMAQSGDLDGVDGIAFHPYRLEGPENSLYDIALFERAAQAVVDRPVWITEWGYSDAWLAKLGLDRARQHSAVMVARLMLTAALARTKAAIVYDLIDDGTDPTDQESGFGLYDYNFKPKPAAAAFRTLSGIMSSCNTYEFKVDPGQNIAIARFYFDGGAVSDVIWTYVADYSREICLPIPDLHPTALKNLSGNLLSLVSCGTSSVTLNISETAGPLILEAQSTSSK